MARIGKKNRSIEELNALAESYVQPMDKKSILKIIFIPGIIFGVVAGAIFLSVIPTLIVFLWGSYIGYSLLLPSIVSRQVEQKAFVERNKFVNNFSQIISSDKSVFDALKETITRLDQSTDLAERMNQSLAELVHSDKDAVFLKIAEEFKEDEAFSQFIEQVSITENKGKINIGTLKNLKTIHNENMIAQQTFIEEKAAHMKGIQMIFGLVCAIPLMFMTMTSFSEYRDIMTGNLFSMGIMAIWIVLVITQFTAYVKRIYDDSIMEITS